MTHDAHKQHKVIHRIDERLTAVENIVLVTAQTAAILLTMIGFFGFILTLCFDKITRGLWQEISWMQMSGLMVTLGIFLTGALMIFVIRKASNGHGRV